MVDGVSHRERTPEHLRRHTRPAPLGVGPQSPAAAEAERLVHACKIVEIDRFNVLIAECQRRASMRSPRAPEGAKDQTICAGRAVKLWRSRSPLAADYSAGLPLVVDPPTGPNAPRNCSQATKVVAAAALVKLARSDYWGSPEWRALYGRGAHVECIFGNLRDSSTQNIRRGFCRVAGLIKTTLMLTFEVKATNLRPVREWTARTGEISDPLHEPFPEGFGLEDIDADGNVLSVARNDSSPPGT